MSNYEYILAGPEYREEVIDLGNYVFSQAHVPHDFKALLPKVYADHVGEVARHFIAKRDDGRVRALVGCMPLKLHVLDKVLSTGFVGTVSVHPYSRGEGHMKKLMPLMIEDSRALGYDMLILGGQRQRYNYFGFDRAGLALTYTISNASLRHCVGNADVSNITFSELTEDRPEEVDFAHSLSCRATVHGERPRENFLDIMHSWKSSCRLIRRDGEMIGYVMGPAREIGLTDESLLPLVLKALFAADNLSRVDINVAPYETERIRAITNLGENCSVRSLEMVNVLNWQPVLDAFMKLKASYGRMGDGCVTLGIDGGSYTLRVENGEASVACEGRTPDLELEHLEAHRVLFGMEAVVCSHPLPHGWLPLPFYFSSPDGF